MKHAILFLGTLLLLSLPVRAQWTLQPFTFANTIASYSPNVSSLSVVDAQTVWAISVNQFLYQGTYYNLIDNEVAHTTNGGTTWTVQTVPDMDFYNESITNITGLSATTALICTSRITSNKNPDGGRILKTVDGGTTWTTTQQLLDPLSYPDFFFFFGAAEGICVGDPTPTNGNHFEVYRTLDAGATWHLIKKTTTPAALEGETAYTDFSAQVGDDVWFSTTAGRVFHSKDRGRNWSVASTSLTGVGAISFRDAQNGLVYAPDAGGLVRTTDGGTTWQPVAYTGPLHRVIARVPGTNQYLSVGQGPDAGTAYSRDNGTTWTALETTRSHYSLAVLSPIVAWSGAVDYSEADRAGLGAYKLTSTVLGTRAGSAPSAFSLYPNPSPDGRVTLTVAAGTRLADAELTVLDALGRCVLTRAVPRPAAPTLTLDLGRPAPGLYTVQLRTSAGLTQQKLVVE